MPFRRRLALLSAAAALLAGPSRAQPTAQDPLPSWRDGAAKQAVVAFVDRVTTPGPDFVQPGARLAVLGDDGGRDRYPTVRYRRLAVQPQLELLAYLQGSGFRTLVASGGEIGLQGLGAVGDQAMLQYTSGRDGPSLALLVHHDTANRAYAGAHSAAPPGE